MYYNAVGVQPWLDFDFLLVAAGLWDIDWLGSEGTVRGRDRQLDTVDLNYAKCRHRALYLNFAPDSKRVPDEG